MHVQVFIMIYRFMLLTIKSITIYLRIWQAIMRSCFYLCQKNLPIGKIWLLQIRSSCIYLPFMSRICLLHTQYNTQKRYISTRTMTMTEDPIFFKDHAVPKYMPLWIVMKCNGVTHLIRKYWDEKLYIVCQCISCFSVYTV